MDKELEKFRNEWKREVERKVEEKRKLKKLDLKNSITQLQINLQDNEKDLDGIVEKGKQLVLEETPLAHEIIVGTNAVSKPPLSHPPSVAESSISYDSKHTEDEHLINHFKHHTSSNSPSVGINGARLDLSHSEIGENAIGNKSLTASERALIAFEKAVEREHSGKMTDAVQLYREAFKLNERVDKMYREKYFAKAKPPPLNTSLVGTKVKGSKGEPSSANKTIKSKMHKKSISIDSLEENDLGNEVIDPTNISAIIPNMEELQFLPLDETIRCPISVLPAEILVKILDTLAEKDLSSFTKVSYTCKKFAYLAYSSESIWKNLCLREFMDQHYYFETDEPSHNTDEDLDTEDENESMQDQVISHSPLTDIRSLFRSTDIPLKNSRNCVYTPTVDFEYNLVKRFYSHSWRKMFLTRPRVRFNGVYISTCNYIRPGIGQNWNSPIHMVTYYRYLRLYRDGTCINLLSTDEPNDVVPLFNKLTPGSSGYTASITRSDGTIIFRPKKIYPGTWSFDESFGEIYDTIEKKHKKISSKANLMIETEGSVKKYKFCMDLEMSNGSKNTKFNKLSWQRFYFQNIITLENEDLYLKNDKPFHFSRVLSYER